VVPVAAVALLLAGLRLWTGPWLHTYNPGWIVQLDGWPAEWEITYFLVHVPSFVGDASPALGFAPVHTRTMAELYLASTLYGWTRSAYWSFAAVDLAGWLLATLATYHVALHLGASRPAALATATLTAASPILVSNMWMHVFHVAEFATMPLGLWAAFALVKRYQEPLRLGAGLGLLLLLLSVTYQYQWIVGPLAGVLVLSRPGVPRRQGVPALLLAAVVFVIATAGLRALLAAVASSSPGDQYAEAVSRPEALAAAQLAALLASGHLGAIVRRAADVWMLVDLYHPLVAVASFAGLLLLPRKTWLLASLAMAATLIATILYRTPWTAMTAYPVVYAGAGVCATALASQAARRLALKPALARSAHDGLAVGIVALFAALTNLDLAGNPSFLLHWWSYYAGRFVF
jgi:hypothetical protein